MKIHDIKTICAMSLAMACALASCDSLLEQEPRDRFVISSDFWNSSSQVESYTNTMYENFAGYSSGSSFGWFYFKSLSDDQVNPDFDNWTFVSVPGSSTYWNNAYTEIRRANYMINGMESSTMNGATRNYYIAVGRLNRAWQYYQLVRMYGDVQWLNQVILDTEAEEIYGERTDRDVVIDSVLADIDYAVSNLGDADKCSWSSHLALAIKAEVCLYEGTYCKYRTTADNAKAPDADRAKRYLNEAADAAKRLIDSGDYKLTATYGEVYNSFNLNNSTEVIFYRNYEKDVLCHNLVAYLSSSTQQRGISKDAFDAFLFADGKPLATTSLNTDDKAVADSIGYSIRSLLDVRDKRLGVLIDDHLAFRGHGYVRDGSLSITSSTGYSITKYDNTDMESSYRLTIGRNYTDAPLFWLAVVYLEYAEAKAELGTITQADLDNTINLLQKRAGLPGLTLTPDADPANNMGVNNLIWEIRRCRRCELMTDNWFRYWDLVRWHQLHLLDTSKYPNIMLGANMRNVTDLDDTFTLTGDGYVVANGNSRTFQSKYYFFPIPSDQITQSKGVTKQNQGW